MFEVDTICALCTLSNQSQSVDCDRAFILDGFPWLAQQDQSLTCALQGVGLGGAENPKRESVPNFFLVICSVASRDMEHRRGVSQSCVLDRGKVLPRTGAV